MRQGIPEGHVGGEEGSVITHLPIEQREHTDGQPPSVAGFVSFSAASLASLGDPSLGIADPSIEASPIS